MPLPDELRPMAVPRVYDKRKLLDQAMPKSMRENMLRDIEMSEHALTLAKLAKKVEEIHAAVVKPSSTIIVIGGDTIGSMVTEEGKAALRRLVADLQKAGVKL